MKAWRLWLRRGPACAKDGRDRGIDVANILVVDDDDVLCKLLHDVLSEEGHDVRCAHHGLAALDEIARRLPDLVLTDIQMPHLDGIGLLGSLVERGLRIPVVLMSAVRQRELPQGVALVAKPFDLDDLLATVERSLSTAA